MGCRGLLPSKFARIQIICFFPILTTFKSFHFFLFSRQTYYKQVVFFFYNLSVEICSFSWIRAFNLGLSDLLYSPFIWIKIQSIEIQKRVGAFSAALDTINKCLSEAIGALSRGRLDGESRTAGLIHSGNELVETFKYYPEVRLFTLFLLPYSIAVYFGMCSDLIEKIIMFNWTNWGELSSILWAC